MQIVFFVGLFFFLYCFGFVLTAVLATLALHITDPAKSAGDAEFNSEFAGIMACIWPIGLPFVLLYALSLVTSKVIRRFM